MSGQRIIDGLTKAVAAERQRAAEDNLREHSAQTELLALRQRIEARAAQFVKNARTLENMAEIAKTDRDRALWLAEAKVWDRTAEFVRALLTTEGNDHARAALRPSGEQP